MKLILSNDVSKFTLLQTTLHSLSSQERLRYAAKRFFVFFGLALVSLPIPVAHMILVPTFLFLAFFISVKSYAVKYQVKLPPQTACPACQKSLPSNHILTDDFRLKCPECFSHLFLHDEKNVVS